MHRGVRVRGGTAPGAIIAYHLGEGSRSRISRFTERVLGQDRRENGRLYRRRGLLDQIPHWKVSRGVLVVRAQDRARVVRELRRWTRDVEAWPIPLTSKQLRRLATHPE